MTKIKLLHILWSGGIGGAEEYVCSLMDYLNNERYEVHLCFLSGQGPIYEEAKRRYRRVTFIGMRNGFDIFGALRFWLYLYKERFDLLHLHTRNILCNLVIRLSGLKSILTHHLSPGDTKDVEKSKLFYRLFSCGFKKITAISDVVKDSLMKDMRVAADKIIVVPNSIDLRKYNNSSEIRNRNEKTGYTLGFVGRMEYFKRPYLFIDVAKKILENRKDFDFVMVGDGTMFSSCKKRISAYRIEGHFKLLGFRRGIARILTGWDGLFFCSFGEGFGLVILEAMAMRVPVFAIDSGAVSEIIKNKVNGLLLETEDPAVIARQIVDYLEGKELISRIKEAAFDTVRSKFSMPICTSRIEKIYEEALKT